MLMQKCFFVLIRWFLAFQAADSLVTSPILGLQGVKSMMLKPFADPFSLSTISDPSCWQT